MQKRTRTKLTGIALALLIACGAGPAHAAGDSTASEALLGTGAALCTLIYGPLKISYAVVGTGISGLAWLFTGGSTEVSAPIFYASVRGDYVVTPEHLTLERPLEFVGRYPGTY